MSEPFDPYYKWLAIPPAEQPPNHYRLLGLPLFESDRDVIAAAAVQRMNFVRKFQNGSTAAAADKLTKEITSAWACLTGAGNKQQYDELLQLHLAASHASSPQDSPVPELPPAAIASSLSSYPTEEVPAPFVESHVSSPISELLPPSSPAHVPSDDFCLLQPAPAPAPPSLEPAFLPPAAHPATQRKTRRA